MSKVVKIYKTSQCSPCIQMTPHLIKLQKEGYPIEIVPEEDQEEFVKAGISSVPTILIVNNEEVVSRTTGYQGEQELLQLFNENGLTTG